MKKTIEINGDAGRNQAMCLLDSVAPGFYWSKKKAVNHLDISELRVVPSSADKIHVSLLLVFDVL